MDSTEKITFEQLPQAVSDPKKAVGHPRFHFSNPYQPMLPIGHR